MWVSGFIMEEKHRQEGILYDFFSTIFNRNAALYGGPEGHGCPGFGDDDRGPSAVPDWTNLLGFGRALPPFVGICFLCIYVFPHAVAQLGKTGTGKRLVFIHMAAGCQLVFHAPHHLERPEVL